MTNSIQINTLMKAILNVNVIESKLELIVTKND